MAENGMNGHDVAVNQWKVGLMNSEGKYLTAESFGHKVNASGVALKKKQMWILEQDPADTENFIYIRSSQNFYMTADKYGEVKVDVEAENKGKDERFTVEYSSDGKWAFKNVTHRNYLSGLGDQVKCFNRTPEKNNWWSIQLYAHPQIHLRNVKRKRCANLNMDTSELECSKNTPWGSDATVLLEFDEGKYTLKSCDNRYLSCDGPLEEDASDKTKYCMEMHSGCLAFKDCNGRYLTAVGKGTMKGKNKTITKDELFTIDDSHPQCQIISHNDKSVSVKQGLDVTANQPKEEIGETEIFQMKYNKASDTWAFRASTEKYWALQDDTGTVQAKQAEPTKNCYFTIDWQDDGTVGIKGPDGKYLSNKPTGILYSTGTDLQDVNKFRILVTNLPQLVLKSEFGFVGTNPKETQYICNKTKYDMLQVTPDTDGTYTIKNKNGKSWYVGDDSMVYLDENRSTKFKFQFCGNAMMAIRAPNGCFLKGEQNGLFKATAEDISSSSLWEF
ncbi:fascin-like [Mercenaria mercenaria]|uniref:fascin-like n=1 Tax=Mercenaria mercenaria TaxID=6596 RepID=UPI00234FA393|nr:fascin-like [Mercenaria mercenaria]